MAKHCQWTSRPLQASKHERRMICMFIVQVIFSSLYQQVVPFTRDYSEIRNALGKLEEYNKTCVDVALSGVDQLLTDEWGCTSHCQVRI